MKYIKILIFLVFSLFSMKGISSENPISPDVVVIVDTSISMKDTGMDPKRASLLVSKLLSDVVPGKLVFIRLLDLEMDTSLLPATPTGKKIPCSDNQSVLCNEVISDGDWIKMAYDKHYGVLERNRMGSNSFKQQLDSHLEQKSKNSLFYLAFAAANGVFDSYRGTKNASQHLIWLSDGKANNPQIVMSQISDMISKNINIDAIIFGEGDSTLAKNAGIPYIQSHGPADLMKLFADAFRKIIKAPYDIDNRLSIAPEFKMLPNILNSWVVVYGNDSLSNVSLTSPNGSIVKADYAQDKQKGAGAYHVALISKPESGIWRINVNNGGNDVAYAVIQNSSLYPSLDEPINATTGAKVLMVSSIKSGIDDKQVFLEELIRGSELTANIEGNNYQLTDDGKNGDRNANDGFYSGYVSFPKEGNNSVVLRLKNPQVDKTRTFLVNASVSFKYTGGNIEVDLGIVALNNKACRSTFIDAEQKGNVHFIYQIIDSLPAEHTVSVFSKQKNNQENEFILSPKEAITVCLNVGETAPSSTVIKQPFLLLKVAGSSSQEQQFVINLSWQVNGLSFWGRWAWLFFWILGILAFIFIVLGFILPHRFRSSLHIAMGQDMEELNEYAPMQLKRWPHVRIGFYRNEKAYVYDDFRVSGKQRGASVEIVSDKQNIKITAINGRELYRKNIQQQWELLENNVLLRSGEVLRIGSDGLFFKLLDQ